MTILAGPDFLVVALTKTGTTSLEAWTESNALLNIASRQDKIDMKDDSTIPIYAAYRDPFSRALAGVYEGLKHHAIRDDVTIDSYAADWLRNPTLERIDVKNHTQLIVDRFRAWSYESFTWFHYSQLNDLPAYINQTHQLDLVPIDTKHVQGPERDEMFGKDFENLTPQATDFLLEHIKREHVPKIFLSLKII